MPERNGQVVRIYHVISVLENSRYGVTVKEIWDKLKEQGFDCSERTVYRDLQALQQTHFPLSSSKDQSDETSGAEKWKLEKHAKVTEHFALSPKELLALYLARGVLTPLRETPFYHDLETIFNKIETRIPGKAKEHLDELATHFRFDPVPKWGLGLNPDVLDTIRAATYEKQVVKATYSSVNGQDKRERRLGPHFIYLAKGSIYLVAEDLEDGVVKIWSLPRMSDASMVDEPYEKPAIDPEEYFKSAFGIFAGGIAQKVKLEFSPKIAPFIKERGWHPTQKIVSRADGSIQFEMEVSITHEVVQWVLGFGPEAKVLEPMELRKQLLDRARSLELMYKSEISCDGCFKAITDLFKEMFFSQVPEFNKFNKMVASDIFSHISEPLNQKNKRQKTSAQTIDLNDYRTTAPRDRFAAYRIRFMNWLNNVAVDGELTVPSDELRGRSPLKLNSFILKDTNNEDWVLLKTKTTFSRIRKSDLLKIKESFIVKEDSSALDSCEGRCIALCEEYKNKVA